MSVSPAVLQRTDLNSTTDPATQSDMTIQADKKYTSALVSSVYSAEEDATAFE